MSQIVGFAQAMASIQHLILISLDAEVDKNQISFEFNLKICITDTPHQYCIRVEGVRTGLPLIAQSYLRHKRIWKRRESGRF